MGDLEDFTELAVRYDFFKGLSTATHTFFCDFHTVVYQNGLKGYRVLLQTSGRAEILVNLVEREPGQWTILNSTSEVAPELELQIVLAILKRESSS